jgi:hypothetical protein
MTTPIHTPPDLERSLGADIEYKRFTDDLRVDITKAANDMFRWSADEMLKVWISKLRMLNTAFDSLDKAKATFYNDLHLQIFTVLKDEKQEFHQLVTDSLTSYVSDLRDKQLEINNNIEKSNQLIEKSNQLMETVRQELARTQHERGTNSKCNSSTPPNDRNINNPSSHSNSNAIPNINNKDSISNDIPNANVDDSTVKTGTANSISRMDARTASLANTALSQLTQSSTPIANSSQYWADVHSRHSTDSSPTPTANTSHAPPKDTTPNATPQDESNYQYYRQDDQQPLHTKPKPYNNRDQSSPDSQQHTSRDRYMPRDQYYDDAQQYKRQEHYSVGT